MFKHLAGLWLVIAVSAIPFGRVGPAIAQPVCPIEDQAHCQSPNGIRFPSDRLIGIRRADDFRPTGDTIDRICFYPCFIGGEYVYPTFPCDGNTGGTPPPDDWLLKIYEDDFGSPGPLLSSIPSGGLQLIIDGKSPPTGTGNCWQYSAPILSPVGVPVVPGDCYWLELTGLGEMQQQGPCINYLLSSRYGNRYSLNSDLQDFEQTSPLREDVGFCLSSGVESAPDPLVLADGGCGNWPACCCKPQGTCLDNLTLSQCGPLEASQNPGVPFPFLTCSDVSALGGCPRPANDLCVNAETPIECTNQTANPNLGTCSESHGSPDILEVCDRTVGVPPQHDCAWVVATCQVLPTNVSAYRCMFEVDNSLAQTDGPSTFGPSCGGTSPQAFAADIWYQYRAPCTGAMTIHTCAGSLNRFDSMLQIFGDNSPTCPSCPVLNHVQSLGCSDDNCIEDGAALRIQVVENGCYLLRFGSFAWGADPALVQEGLNLLDLGVVCDPVYPIGLPQTAPVPHDRRKNRYISFAPNNPTTAAAFRIDKTSGTAGSCWVSAPDASGNAKCTSAPVYRTWPEAVVHVGDCAIAPVQNYRVVAVSEEFGPMPVTLAVGTIIEPTLNNKKWGDVAGANNGVEWTPPNQFTNVNDILAVLAYISNAPIKPTFQVVNLQAISSADPCLNAFVNTADVLIVVKAAAGDAYPFTTDPGSCPNCP